MPPTLEEEEDYRGDTIIVKGEYPWTAPSSPESMSPELEPPGLLARNTMTPRNLESPEPQEEDYSTPNPLPDQKNPQPDLLAPRAPRQRHKQNVTTMEERLMMMPEKRPLPWRDGVEPGAENETGGDSRRKQIRFGCLLATRGEVQEVPCNSCANGRGKFRVCVALDGYFKGACASCQLSGRPNRCSIKKNDGKSFAPGYLEDAKFVKDVLENPTIDTPRPEAVSRNEHELEQTNDGPQPKRRKTDTVPDWESARPQWEQELGDSHARQQMNQIVQRPWATVNSPVIMPHPAHGMNGSSIVPSNAIDQSSSMGWATVNQPVVVAPPPQTYNGAESNGGSYRNSLDQGRREDTVNNEDGSVALIDTLPKNKQRQVYGLVSGLQGGIEHLQRELDSLKRALGIDDED